VHLTDLVGDTGVVQDALSGSCLTSVNVSHDANVSNLIQVSKHVLCHGYPPKVLLLEKGEKISRPVWFASYQR
jgi:hypothetical protein